MIKINSKFLKYAFVGVIGTFTHLGILTFLVEALRYHPVISSASGFLITVVISYYLNYKWTFQSKSRHRSALPRYVAVSLAGLCLNTTIMFITVNVLHLWYIIGQTISIIIIPVHNFVLNSSWSFKTWR